MNVGDCPPTALLDVEELNPEAGSDLAVACTVV